MNNFHTPVLLKEVIENLRVEKGKKYIDATIGGGGHTVEILKNGGVVLGIDCDREAIEYVRGRWKIESRRWKIKEDNLTLVRGNFRDIDKIAIENGFTKVAGIIFDLGVSSYQLETAERGFSFQKEGLLDMRMDQELHVKAGDLIQVLKKGELYELFSKLGEESRAWQLSSRIVSARGIKPIETTQDLANIIGSISKGFSKIHPATKMFQALRIAVNDELNALKEALPKAVELLEENARILVISYHSLEDRIVKKLFLEFEALRKGLAITKKPIVPSLFEIEKNRRSRSAKLRVFETRSASSG
jgi:16S rRNA (cytosine1402-N4)-methyltransferase